MFGDSGEVFLNLANFSPTLVAIVKFPPNFAFLWPKIYGVFEKKKIKLAV